MKVEITSEDDAVREGAALLQLASRFWWVYLVTGAFWLLFSIVVFRFDYTTVSAISILFGIVMIVAAVDQLTHVPGSTRGWKLTHLVLALVFVVIGVVSFVHPGDTFEALAAVMSFYFIVAGFFDLFVALLTHGAPGWWIGLVAGVAQLLLGFWAAGDFGHASILLVVWVGAIALIRGIMQVLFAFTLRRVRHAT